MGIQQKNVKKIRLEFVDGSIEEWDFPDGTIAHYRETHNDKPPKGGWYEAWIDHEIFWNSALELRRMGPIG